MPIHEEYGMPGHVEVVVGQLGEIRRIGQSSYNGYRHMNGAELQDLLQRGWGVGNHSWSHEIIEPDMLDRELRQAKEVLEEAIAAPVILYCSPGNNTKMADHVLAACRELGYLGAMSLTDALNRPGDELFWLNRTALHDHFYEPFYSEYDPFRNIRHAREDGGWIIDYCHCPIEEAIHPNKDCSEAQLRRRFETVLSEGGDEVCRPPTSTAGGAEDHRNPRVVFVVHRQVAVVAVVAQFLSVVRCQDDNRLVGHTRRRKSLLNLSQDLVRPQDAALIQAPDLPHQRLVDLDVAPLHHLAMVGREDLHPMQGVHAALPVPLGGVVGRMGGVQVHHREEGATGVLLDEAHRPSGDGPFLEDL